MASVVRSCIALSLFLGLAGCASRSLETELTECVYPDSPRAAAPSFICDKALPGYPISELRTVPEGDSAVSDRIQSVFLDQVKLWSELWAATWFTDIEDQTLAEAYLQSMLADDARVVRSRFSPKNQLWLLIGIDKSLADIEASTRSYISTP